MCSNPTVSLAGLRPARLTATADPSSLTLSSTTATAALVVKTLTAPPTNAIPATAQASAIAFRICLGKVAPIVVTAPHIPVDRTVHVRGTRRASPAMMTVTAFKVFPVYAASMAKHVHRVRCRQPLSRVTRQKVRRQLEHQR